MKDHEIAEFVNELLHVSRQFAGTQQLRTHIRNVVLTHVDRADERIERTHNITDIIEEIYNKKPL